MGGGGGGGEDLIKPVRISLSKGTQLPRQPTRGCMSYTPLGTCLEDLSSFAGSSPRSKVDPHWRRDDLHSYGMEQTQ